MMPQQLVGMQQQLVGMQLMFVVQQQKLGLPVTHVKQTMVQNQTQKKTTSKW